MIKAGVLFGGFGGVEIGMLQAGIAPVWSIEKNLGVATVAEMNFDHKIIQADILDVDPHTLEKVDILHASPPCPAFSLANATGRGETKEDIALARKTAQFAKILRPKIFTLENVWLYRKSESWQIIRDSLYEAGYWLDVAHINMADYSVPQTRKRMIVRAILGGFVPYLPQPELWHGWYQSIEDLIPDLPDSQFAPWQLARLPGQTPRAFIVPGDNASNNTIRFDSQPMVTIQTRDTGQCPHRAFIVGGQYQTPNTSKRIVQNRSGDRPVWTITASEHGDMRAWLSCGRVVSMTVQALARFQAFPKWYRLPASNKLACYGIGNAMPPLAYQKIIRGLIEISGLAGGAA